MATYVLIGMALTILVMLATYAALSDDNSDKRRLNEFIKNTPYNYVGMIVIWPAVLVAGFVCILTQE